MFIKTFDVQSYWIDSVLRLNEHCILDACKTVTRVSVPFTEGHYCGIRKGQTRNWPLYPQENGQRDKEFSILSMIQSVNFQYFLYEIVTGLNHPRLILSACLRM